MKNILIILILFGELFLGSAQTISRKVISSSGGSFTTGAKQLDFTIGESFITTLDVGSNIITQGFQQPCPQLIPNTFLGINAPLDPVQAGTSFNLSANFSGANITSAQWYFSSSGEINNLAEAEFSFDGSIYGGMVTDMFNFDTSQTGVYSVKLVVTNICGIIADVDYEFVVIYDSNGGFVTGAGRIYSPEGALVGTTFEGDAKFGFTAKYVSGNNDVTELKGNTSFQFKEADFDFKSSNYEAMSLVVSGQRKATFKGVGTVNDIGNHKFLVSVIDGDATGGDGLDKFRIKVWGNNNNIVIYDNEFNVVENADASTVITAGSIVIHKPKTDKNSSARSTDSKSDTPEKITFEGFKLVVWPNPSRDAFSLKLNSGNSIDAIEIQVYDLNGRRVYSQVGTANQEYQIGNAFQSGLYFVNVIQGKESQQVKLIKY